MLDLLLAHAYTNMPIRPAILAFYPAEARYISQGIDDGLLWDSPDGNYYPLTEAGKLRAKGYLANLTTTILLDERARRNK